MEKRLPLNSNKQCRDENMVENTADQSKDYEREIFNEISRCLSDEEAHNLGLQLGLTTNLLTDLEKEVGVHHYGRPFKIVRMLEKWKEKKNPETSQFLLLLASALKAIDRNDVVDRIAKRCHHRNEDVLTDLLKEMKDAQKDNFKDLKLPRSLWLKKKCLFLEELYVELTMIMKNKRGEKERINFESEKMFEEIDKKIPRRILIEGQPGYGKTTLLTKLLSDWSKGEKYICDLFDLVFVVALRNYEGDLSSLLLKQCEMVTNNKHLILQEIEAIEERVLLLLDGFDETPTEVKKNLFRLFKGDVYPQMTVVVTCRTGFFQLETESDKNFETMENKGFEMHFVWDKRVHIEGISTEKRKAFLQKYLNITDEKLKKQISQTNLHLSDLYECPLFLLLLAVLIQEKDMRQITTKTELYKTLFNFVINRSLEKLKGKFEEFDVFDLTVKSDEFGCRNLLLNFGQLCLDKIKTDSLVFQENELWKCSGGKGEKDLIFKLGFLSKQISFFSYEVKEHYEPIHKSFLEFSAAFFLSTFEGMEREIDKENLGSSQLNPISWSSGVGPIPWIFSSREKLLHSFLGGFLQSNVFKLIDVFYPPQRFAYHSFSSDRHMLILLNMKDKDEHIWKEISYTDNNVKSFRKSVRVRSKFNTGVLKSFIGSWVLPFSYQPHNEDMIQKEIDEFIQAFKKIKKQP